tara:strand:+ start:2055 stop:4217 length:2163 start_codon:yes stop_codon:yes gene_type:complete
MDLLRKDKIYILKKNNQGFAIPQILIIGVGIAVGISGLMAASILGLTGSRINRQELIAKASSYSGITTLRSLLNDGSEFALFHYFWVTSKNRSTVEAPNPSEEYWPDDDWCNEGAVNCFGRQKAPICTHNEKIDWDGLRNNFGFLFDNVSDSFLGSEGNYSRGFNQSFNVISTKYTGTEKNGLNSILLEGVSKSIASNEKTASNKVRVNLQVNSETNEEGFGFLSIGENQSDDKGSLFLGNLTISPIGNSKGSIIWRRNLVDNDECGNFKYHAKGSNSILPESGSGGIWVQSLGLPKQPRLSNVNDLGILICTPTLIQKEDTNCIINSEYNSEKVYRIHSLYAKGPGSKFEISTTDNSKIILELMGDIDISNGGIFCHKDGSNACGTGKAENLTILFKQKTKPNMNGNQLACNRLDELTGGVNLKTSLNFSNSQTSIDNNKLPGSSFLIDNTGENSFEKFSAFIYGPQLTLLSTRPENEWVQVTNTEQDSSIAGIIITSRGSYGLIQNTLGNSYEDKMVNIILTPKSNLIPYLGQKDLDQSNFEDDNNIEIIGVGYKANPLPVGSQLNPNANRILLIYNRETENTAAYYSLRTFYIQNINSANQTNSEYSYPLAFARMHPNENTTNVNLNEGLESLEAKSYLEAFGIKVEKLTLNNPRNFSGAAWVKNLCFDGTGEKTWEFSKQFIEKLSGWHGEEFNWGINYYRGRSIILWDTLRDFQS